MHTLPIGLKEHHLHLWFEDGSLTRTYVLKSICVRCTKRMSHALPILSFCQCNILYHEWMLEQHTKIRIVIKGKHQKWRLKCWCICSVKITRIRAPEDRSEYVYSKSRIDGQSYNDVAAKIVEAHEAYRIWENFVIAKYPRGRELPHTNELQICAAEWAITKFSHMLSLGIN